MSNCNVDDSSTSWVLVSSLLVLGMNPALAFFEAGMLRSKNTLSIISQIFTGVITLSVLWILFGYSLTYGNDQYGIIGDFSDGLWIDVSYSDCSVHAPHIPHACFALFQMMFAVITPLLITGSFAERIKFKVFFWFTVLWEIFVYYPLAHWIWGGGFFEQWGVLDFAGGIVIHTSAGASSLVVAMMLGKRTHFFSYYGEFPPSNLPLAAIGAALLWVGWFGFNGGSALQSGPIAVSALVSTQVACSVSAFTWLCITWFREKPSSVALMNGALAGLAGITPASGYISTQASFVMGLVFGVASYVGVYINKHILHIDDALDVSSIHGLTGVLGSLAIGIFSDRNLNPEGGADGAWFGRPALLGYQTVAVLTTIVYSAVWTYLILKFLDLLCVGLRLSPEEEEIGTDWTEHREIAYHKLHVLDENEKSLYIQSAHEGYEVLNEDTPSVPDPDPTANDASTSNHINMNTRSKTESVPSPREVTRNLATSNLALIGLPPPLMRITSSRSRPDNTGSINPPIGDLPTSDAYKVSYRKLPNVQT